MGSRHNNISNNYIRITIFALEFGAAAPDRTSLVMTTAQEKVSVNSSELDTLRLQWCQGKAG